MQRISGVLYKEDAVYYLDENEKWVHENDADFTSNVLMVFHDALYFAFCRYKTVTSIPTGVLLVLILPGFVLCGDVP